MTCANYTRVVCIRRLRDQSRPLYAPPRCESPRIAGQVDGAFGFPLPVPVGQKWGLVVRRMSGCSRAVPASPTRYATSQGRGRLA